jgi:anti-sigma factor RsiW
MREMIDHYLDGALDVAGREGVERAIAQDPAAARLLTQMKAERAVRRAAYDSYAPSPLEAAAATSQFLAACRAEAADDAPAPAGRIGPPRPWFWRAAGVAAVLALTAGAYGLGRSQSPVQVVEKAVEVAKPEFQVVYLENGTPQEVRTFASADDRDRYIQQILSQRGGTIELRNSGVIAVASLADRGDM